MVATIYGSPQSDFSRMHPRPGASDSPEFYHYEDSGCEVSETCLNCPLPRCKYDDPGWYRRNRRLAQDFLVWQSIEQEGLTARQAAERFALTERTIYRRLRRCREAASELTATEAAILFAPD